MRMFYNKNFAEFENDAWKKIANHLNKIQQVDDVNSIATQLISTFYNYKIPNLINDITSELLLEDRDGKTYQDDMNGQYGRNDVVATATYHIPFEGNEIFFGIKPTQFKEVGIEIDLRHQLIQFKIRTEYVRIDLPEFWVKNVKDKAIEVKENIEENLRELKADLDRSKIEILAQIKPFLENILLEREQQKKRNSNINPFG